MLGLLLSLVSILVVTPAAAKDVAAATGPGAAPALQFVQAGQNTRKPRRSAPAAGVRAPATHKPAAAPAKTMSPREIYAAMNAADRSAIQSDLMWTGYYDGIVDGEFGDRSIAAVRAFQKRSNAKPTGILNPAERKQLAALAKSRQEQVGWRLIDDSATGVRLGIPGKLATRASRGRDSARWASASGDIQIETFRVNDLDTTLSSVAARQRTAADRRIDYDVQRPEFFVLSGEQGGKKFYVRAHARGEDVRGFTVLYDPAKQEQMQTVVIALSNSFVPFRANPAGTTRRKVEYSSGVVVSTAGDILVDRAATDGCHVIRIAGLGPADRIAEHAGSGVALLRLHGLARMRPAAFAGAPTGERVTLVGIADPRLQDGGHTVTTSEASVMEDGKRLEHAPVAGFSGGAAAGADGRLRGIVLAEPEALGGPPADSQATLLSAETAARFLRAHGVSPASGPAGLQHLRAAVVRVICVRP